MQSFPIFLTLTDRRALVVGGGEPAARKVELLLSAGAQVSLVAETVVGDLASLIAEGRISWAGRGFDEADLDGLSLVIVASDDTALAVSVSQAAQRRGLPVNVVDRPRLSSFIMPAIVDRAPITIAISTGGAAPALARRIRAEIERALPAALGRLARFAEIFRGQVRRTLDNARDRRRFWDRVFGGRIAELALAGDEIAARRELIRLLDGFRSEAPSAGMVHLVGAGPGDPDLLTLKAHRLLQRADVLVYDRLVSDEILSMARRDAERVYVGKRRANHCVPQDEINDRLVALARAGKSVVRLKGGDPFVFGRGGEECQHLATTGIPFRIVPGITAGIGGLAYAGMPATHRDTNHSVIFLTGHDATGNMPANVNWQAVALASPVIVMYMAVKHLGEIAAALMAGGRAADDPVTIVSNASMPHQEVASTTLGGAGAFVAANEPPTPAIVVVGRAADWRSLLDWYKGPLRENPVG